MNTDVTAYIDQISQSWQANAARRIRELIRQAVPGIQEWLQYGKPHFLKDGKYAFVLGAAKGWLAFTIFNAGSLQAPEGIFEPGDPDRKTVKIRAGQTVDYELLAQLIRQAAAQ